MDNQQRVAKVRRILGLRGEDNEKEYYRVADVLTDLRHYCDHQGLDFDQEMTTSITFYESECEEQKETA
tara:strand:+ start:164 stop:370 length:207 start_codon:yes stop_codon:yes gene_type:complete